MNTFVPSRYTGWLILAAIVAMFMLPQLCGRGMFFDGITYSTISRNLAEGKGTFWNPSYTETLYPVFHEHPPLVFGIQSLFFQVLGDHYWTEKVYTFFTFLLSALLIIAIWRTHEKKFVWLPVLFWASCQIVGWGYVNNMQENTMGIFCLLAVWAFLQSFRAVNLSLAWQILASLSIIAAMLCKGPVGLFPLAIPGWYWLMAKGIPFRKAVLTSIVALLVLAGVFAVLWQLPEAHNNFTAFFNTQLFPALAGKREHIEGTRFFILFQLIRQLIPTILIVGVVYLTTRKRAEINNSTKRLAMFYLAVGFSASLPIMVSLKQMSAYILPAIPFFGLAAATWIMPYLETMWGKSGKEKLFGIINKVLLLVIVGFTCYSLTRINTIVRDKELINSLDNITNQLPNHQTVSIPDDLYTDWALQAYLMRFYHISLDVNNKTRDYLLVSRPDTAKVPAGYLLITPNATGLMVYKKQ